MQVQPVVIKTRRDYCKVAGHN